MEISERLEENGYDLSDFDMSLKIDGFDDACIGTTDGLALVYDYDKLVEVLEKDGISHEDAIDYVDFNIMYAFVGHGKYIQPLIIYTFSEET